MFYKNFPSLIDKGVDVEPLLYSDIFNFEFDYDEWPSTHFNRGTYLRPFNESIFMVRNYYRDIFPEEKFKPISEIDEDDGNESKKLDSTKIYKISYRVNFLPILGRYVMKTQDPYTKEWTHEIMN